MKHFLILLVLVGFIGNIYAAPEPMPEDAFRFSKYVLVGKILSVEIISEPKYSEGVNVSGIVLYTVKVEENLKNPIDENLTFSDEKNIIKVPGYFVREIDPIDIETFPYEINQKVILYIQIDSFDEIPDFDYVIRSDTSKVIGDSLCEKGKKFVKGICVIEEPTPACKSGPKPDGEGWVFVDCEWKQYADVPIDSCERGKAPANNYAWNSQDCLWEWSPLRNENATGPPVESNPTDAPICGPGTELIDNQCVPIKAIKADSQPSRDCLIATASYGSELAPQVQMLREIRDNVLLSTDSGVLFMEGFNTVYYSFSPEIAQLEEDNPMFKEAVKIFITPMVATLSIMTLADEGSESQVILFGLSTIGLIVGMYVVAPVVLVWKVGKRK